MATKTNQFQPLEFTPINFSLTDGTDIPPPPDSPVEPRPPTPGRGPLSSHPTTPRVGAFPADALSTNGVEAAAAALERAVSKDASQSSPPKPAVSPAVSKRPSSVRRFLGIKTSSSADSLYPDKDNRPMSPQSTHTYLSGADSHRSLSRKKSTSWFGKRKSMMFVAKVDEPPAEATKENQEPQQPQRKGPPPPTIPEFAALGTVLGSEMDVDDMFKNIK